MSEDLSAYRFWRPVLSLILKDGEYRLVQLARGSIVDLALSSMDEKGMIQGTYQGAPIRVFSIDVEDRAEPLFPEDSGNSDEPDAELTDHHLTPSSPMSLHLS